MPEELNFESVDDIDSMLDKEFNITEDSVEDDVTNDETIDEPTTDVEESVDSVDNEEGTNEEGTDGTKIQNESDTTATDNKKPTPEEKKEFAFSEIRRENSELKQKAKQNAQYEEFLKQISAEYGYDSVEEFTEAYRESRIAKEAKEKGYDPVLYKQLQDSNRRLEQLERERNEEKLMAKAESFRTAVEKAIVDYGLGENGRNEIFTKLEEAGYSVDQILSSPNPEIIIKGVLSDKIAEISKQKQIEKLNELDNFADEKHISGSSTKTISLDDLIAQEMKEYEKNNFY
mgnify:CR=1 FL=1